MDFDTFFLGAIRTALIPSTLPTLESANKNPSFIKVAAFFLMQFRHLVIVATKERQ